jgi:integral membrane sensor domain MASE1
VERQHRCPPLTVAVRCTLTVAQMPPLPLAWVRTVVVALSGKMNDRTVWVAVDALAGPATARAATAAPAAMMIVRLQIFMVSPGVVSSDPYYLEIPGKITSVA